MRIKPYFSIDIETTGLDINKAQILEIAAVYDDGTSPIEELKTFRQVCAPSTLYYEPYAMAMHSNLLKEIAGGAHFLSDRLFVFMESNFDWTTNSKITVAGKNIAGFDLPILKNNKYMLPALAHRTIDVGSIYYEDFGYVPSLNEINSFIGYKPVAHTALEDALNVVCAIRHKFIK